MRGTYPKSYLTLSAAPKVDRHSDRSAADPVVSHISAELRRVRLARRRGANATARNRLERLIDYVWFSDPDDGAA